MQLYQGNKSTKMLKNYLLVCNLAACGLASEDKQLFCE